MNSQNFNPEIRIKQILLQCTNNNGNIARYENFKEDDTCDVWSYKGRIRYGMNN